MPTAVAPLTLRLVEARAWLDDCLARLPFRFGIVTMRGAPLCVLRVVAETPDGARHEGFASDLLVPKWFEKDPDRSLADSWRCLTDGITDACAAAIDTADLMSPRDHGHRLLDARVMSWTGERTARLLLSHGVSLVERALIDAACRATELPFHRAARDGVLGGHDLARVVRSTPLASVRIRHTVGLLDPLVADDVTRRPPDDLPATLTEAIRTHGLTHFKIKVTGDVPASLERLDRIASVLQREVPGDPVCTLDGNEQFASMADLQDLLERMRHHDRLAWLRGRIISIEQPLSRQRTLDPDANDGLAAISDEIPVIIDEADMDPDAFPDAIALGYRGVSVKNCKGVFRALDNAARCLDTDGRLFLSSEDLTNVPILALQQDMVTASSLGLEHLERNGHHYFGGLDHLPATERDAAVSRHGDLYAGDPARLVIRDGRVMIGSLHDTRGYAYDGPVDLTSRTSLEDWTPDALLASIAGAS